MNSETCCRVIVVLQKSVSWTQKNKLLLNMLSCFVSMKYSEYRSNISFVFFFCNYYRKHRICILDLETKI